MEETKNEKVENLENTKSKENAENKENKIKSRDISLIGIEGLEKSRLIELDACTNCGECIKWCPVIAMAPELTLSISPPAKIMFFKKIIQSQRGIRKILFGNKENFITRIIDKFFKATKLTMTEEEFQHFINDLWACSTCRQCFIVCPAHIDTVELWEGLRKSLMAGGYGPLKNHGGLLASVKGYDNPWQQPRSTRARWTRMAKREKKIKDTPFMLKPPKISKS